MSNVLCNILPEAAISAFIVYIVCTQRTHFFITAFLVGSLVMHLAALTQGTRPYNAAFDAYGVLPLSIVFLVFMHIHHPDNTLLMFTAFFVFLSKVYDKIITDSMRQRKGMNDELLVGVLALVCSALHSRVGINKKRGHSTV